MADETTPYLGLVKPEVNGVETENVWGFDLNANFDKIDAKLAELPTTDAPLDGDIYGRRQGAWSRTVMKTDFDALATVVDTHTHTAVEITDFAEATDDRIATMLTEGANIVLTYDDVLNTMTIASTGGGGGGGGLPPDGDYGDIIVSASGTQWTLDLSDVSLPTGNYGDVTVGINKIWTINPGVITYPKIQNVSANKLLGAATAGVMQEIPCTAAGRALLDDADAAAQRTTLGLGTAATSAATAFQASDPTLSALAFLDGTAGLIEETGLDVFVKRTIGIAAPTSIPTRADADTRYAQLDSPVFIGDARAVTPATADNDTSIATTAFVKAAAVAKAGDTMTGNLTINKVTPTIDLYASAAGQGSFIIGGVQNNNRWALALGDATTETGSNTGSNFGVYRYNDTGVYIDQPWVIDRATGAVSVNADMTVARPTAPTTGAIFFGQTNTKYFWYNGSTRFELTGGDLLLNSATASSSPTTGALTVAGGVGIGGMLNIPNAVVRSSGAVGALTYYDNMDDTAAAQVSLYFRRGSSFAGVGNIVTTNVATTYNTSSSAELKEDLQSFDAGNIIDDTEVYDFKWKDTSERAYGIIAQQAVEVYPQAITHNEKDDWWGVDYSKYVPVILQELKALRARVAELEGGAPIDPKKGR